jgi:hypothetical protein
MSQTGSGGVVSSGGGYASAYADRPQAANLADILERVLDKGIIIAGDIRVNLLDIELLTVKIRLLVVSVDKAEEMGIDWWRHDPMLTVKERGLEEENEELRRRVEELESGSSSSGSGGQRRGSSRAKDGSGRG